MSEPATISIECAQDRHGWKCQVAVSQGDSTTFHEVLISVPELRRYASRETTPHGLVTASFRFLLEREPKESILSGFRLSDIERHFPEFPRMIGKYLAADQ